ncbi:DNA cytosine methyltransferase [Actinokineospora enzanensis]|uniref:DNA cytosine methyltransferase n=1 Tax=Actinokineospora enzanensis TaxID=155975 RepID=UPI0012EB9CF5|nr:DNA cytosine methyltransferase [Actinokineospora enzanensis]
MAKRSTTREAKVKPEVGTSIELFTGGGGLAYALHEAGFRHLLAVELDHRACETLRANVAKEYSEGAPDPKGLRSKWPLIEGDVHKVDFTRWEGKVSVVAGGVPCQPWSLGGAHKGYDDPRNLWPELFRTVRETRPKAVIAENVKGLLRSSFKPYYDYILRELEAPFERRVDGEDWGDHDKRLIKALKSTKADLTERYDVKMALVNAADYGVPQVRWRVVVVAFRKDLGLVDWTFPEPTHSEIALWHSQADGDYWERAERLPREDIVPGILPIHDGKQPWRTVRDAIRGGTTRGKKALPEPVGYKVDHPDFLHHFGWPGAREYPGHTPNDFDRPAKTVKAGVHGVPGGETVLRLDDGSIRYMTVREVARVMTFPDKWELVGPRGEQMRQLGNAVPVELGRVVADSVATALDQAEGSELRTA